MKVFLASSEESSKLTSHPDVVQVVVQLLCLVDVVHSSSVGPGVGHQPHSGVVHSHQQGPVETVLDSLEFREVDSGALV